MKKLTEEVKALADLTINIHSEIEIPLTNLALAIARVELKEFGFYTYTEFNGVKVLLINNHKLK